MTSLLTAFLLVLLLPLFVASWRASLIGLSLQGLLMAWMVAGQRPPMIAATVVTLVDVALVRGLFVPLALRRVLRAQNRPPRHDVIPPNMLSWAVAAVLVTLAFRCADWLHPAGPGHLQIAVVAAGVLLGLFVLASQNGVFSQAVGALRVENAIALLELGAAARPPLGLQIGQLAVFVATAVAYVVYVHKLHPAAEEATAHRSSLL